MSFPICTPLLSEMSYLLKPSRNIIYTVHAVLVY
jgi:hypothetical protein